MLQASDEALSKNALDPQQSVGKDSQADYTAQEPEAPRLMQLVIEPQSAEARMGTPGQGASCAWTLVHVLYARFKDTMMNQT